MRKKVDECPTCGHETFIDEDPMTPSEKKARESLLSDASYLLKSVDHQYSCACETCRQSQVERVASALSEAERRGFERAKRAIMAEYLKPVMFSSGAIMKLNYDDGELDP